MSESTIGFVTVILAIGAALQPLLLGAVFVFVFKYFPTRKEVEMQETNQLARHEENKLRFSVIERDIKELLKRD